MAANSSSAKRGTNSYLKVSPGFCGPVTIKVFDINGKKAKTINLDKEVHNQELQLRMVDLDKGVYVLNAFRKGDFVKSFKFVKD